MYRREIDSVRYWIHITAYCLLLCCVAACKSEPPPAPTSVTVRSVPTEAAIMIDGTVYGMTPVTIPDLAPGEHYAILEALDHRRLNKRFTLEPGENLELDLNLVHDTGYVSFTSKPVGGKIYLTSKSETKLIGETPLTNYLLDTGEYTFEIRLENHHPTQGELAIEHGEYYSLDHTLKAMTARIQVFSRPSGAQVWIDDEVRPEITPANITLPPGEYSVGVYKVGYMMDEQTIDLEPNSVQKIDSLLKEGNMPLGMVLVPAGEFSFGNANKSPDEKPLRKVHLDAFYIDKHEVTNAQFKAVFPAHTFGEHRDRHPVTGVTWKQAADYATAVGKRLPTEMEWEKAARGPTGKEFPWGAVFDQSLANTSTGINSDTKIVGKIKKGVSEYGCYDMAGNVYEWVNDWYNPYPGNEEVRIDYGTVFKVLRGGSFKSDPFEARGARRHYDKPDAAREDYGFRCAKDIEP